MITSLPKLAILFLLLAFLTGCSTTGSISSSLNETEKTHLIKESDWSLIPYEVINYEQVVQISLEQKEDFLAYFNSEKLIDIPPRMRLYNYLDQYVQFFDYQSSTFNSSDALSTKSGNCMSLALVTTSLAQLANLDIGYQVINGAPLYYKEGKTVLSSQHIRSKIYAKEEAKLKDGALRFGRTKLIIDYYKSYVDLPGRHIENDEFKSMYFANLTAEALKNNDIELAYQYSANAMRLFPDSPQNINNHAVVIKNLLGEEQAIKFLQTSFEHKLTSLSLLANYKLYLKSAGEEKKLALVEEKLSYIKDTNPYAWLDKGKQLYEDKRFRKALFYLSEAEKLAPYLDEVYLSKAKVHYKMGALRLAEEELNKAMSAPIKVNDIKLYEAKLAAFEAPTLD